MDIHGVTAKASRRKIAATMIDTQKENGPFVILRRCADNRRDWPVRLFRTEHIAVAKFARTTGKLSPPISPGQTDKSRPPDDVRVRLSELSLQAIEASRKRSTAMRRG
jgi:hypothetical protein